MHFKTKRKPNAEAAEPLDVAAPAPRSERRSAPAPRAAARSLSQPATGPAGDVVTGQLDETPLARARITGQDLLAHLVQEMKGDPEPPLGALLGLLGSIAGFTTVHALVRRIDDGSVPLQAPEAMVMTLPDGSRRYFGNFLNRRLAEQQISLFNLTAGMAKSRGATVFPDLPELFERVTKSAATAEFGLPRLPEGLGIDATPEAMVRRRFAGCLPVLDRYGLHADDHFAACAFAIQQVIARSDGRIDPALSVHIVMECAVPMSKIDPRLVVPAAS